MSNQGQAGSHGPQIAKPVEHSENADSWPPSNYNIICVIKNNSTLQLVRHLGKKTRFCGSTADFTFEVVSFKPPETSH
jgi:hypothetical protein